MGWTGDKVKSINRHLVPILVLLIGSFSFLYRDVIAKLVHDWYIDENYSHGFLVVPIAAYFVWERRQKIVATAVQPNAFGLAIALGSLALLLAGILGAEVFTTEISLIGAITGCVLFLLGWAHLRVLLFPIAFLLLMVPLPAIIFTQITFPLQLLASRVGESVLMVAQIPVLREGNVIHLANTSLEVAEACSGIRSLISLLTLGIVYGYFMDSRVWIRSLLVFATVPLAILANGLRVAGTGVAAHFYGAAAAEGFLHTFSGWLVFVFTFIVLLVLHRLLRWKFPEMISAPIVDRAREPQLTA
jgi:exosortase